MQYGAVFAVRCWRSSELVSASDAVFKSCGALCCSVLQCVAVCCSVLQRVAHLSYRLRCAVCISTKTFKGHIICSVLQCVAVCCSVLQCVAVCYRLRCDACISTKTSRVISFVVCCSVLKYLLCSVFQRVTWRVSVLCSVLHRCNWLQCVAACCSALQRVFQYFAVYRILLQ